jgi:hypothetical protein
VYDYLIVSCYGVVDTIELNKKEHLQLLHDYHAIRIELIQSLLLDLTIRKSSHHTSTAEAVRRLPKQASKSPTIQGTLSYRTSSTVEAFVPSKSYKWDADV